MKIQTQFLEASGLLAAYAPEYKKSHFHLHGRNIDNWTAFKSIFEDDTYRPNQIAKKAFKGAMLLGFYGFTINFLLKIGQKQAVELREYKIGLPKLVYRRTRTYMVQGALLGVAWYIIYDLLCCPHGQTTFKSYYSAYALGGSLATATLYHPSAIIYGALVGLVAGSIVQHINKNYYPQGFRLNMVNFDEQKRHTAQINQVEENLSITKVKMTGRKIDYI